MTLTDGVVFLKPFKTEEDREYLYRFVNAEEKRMTYEMSFRYVRDCWVGETKEGIRGGVVYLSYYPEYDWWVLNAYRDNRVLARLERRDWSSRAADLIINHFFLCEKYKNYDRLYTLHARRKKIISEMVKRKGFQEVGHMTTEVGEFGLFVKVRPQ